MDTGPSCFATPIPVAAIVFGSILIAGVVVSYSLQMVAILKAKSSEGLSYLTLGLALFSSLLTCINYIILNWTPKIACCAASTSPAHLCLQNNLTTMQLLGGALCTMIVYILLLIYFPIPIELDDNYVSQRKAKFRARVTFWVSLVVFGALSVTGVTMHFWIHLPDSVLGIYGKVIGIVSAIVVVVQWSPQLYTTWKQGDAGSLSLPMLFIQLPGSLSTVYFQAFLDRGDITTWGPYMVTAIQQSILIVMCAVFWCKRRSGYSYDELDLNETDDDMFGNSDSSSRILPAVDGDEKAPFGQRFGSYYSRHSGPYS